MVINLIPRFPKVLQNKYTDVIPKSKLKHQAPHNIALDMNVKNFKNYNK